MAARINKAQKSERILSVDIGGSNVKFLVSGETRPRKIPSGDDLSPAAMVDAVKKNARDWDYRAVSLGYCGLVGGSGPLAETENLGSGWVGFDFAAAFGCPVRIVNDAAMQALGSYDGGRMLFIGLGTGLGSVLIVEHAIVQLELGELRYKRKATYSQRFGRAALDEIGENKWRRRVNAIIPSLQRAFLADYVVVGGGNAKHLGEPLPPGVRLGHNLTAFRGGFRLWGIDDLPTHINGHKQVSIAQSKADWRLL
ncbi:MAG: polyphosphate glucokinase [Betaproteobacteria bacterium]|jgi:predicted NBD/HSP70 family sugar kinase|nr:polyphosphate glucokinase [Betaproteobacteria bacterium]